MATTTTYKGLTILSPDPSGAGGILIQDNFKEIADRAGKVNVTTTAPTATNDETEGYSTWSQWYNSSTQKLYICVDATEDNAVWRATGSGNATGVEFQDAATATFPTTKGTAGYILATPGAGTGDLYWKAESVDAQILRMADASGVLCPANAGTVGQVLATQGAGNLAAWIDLIVAASSFKFGNLATATVPSTDGTSGQVLSTNANGTTSWITPPIGNAIGMKFENNATATFPSTDGTSGQVLSTNSDGSTFWLTLPTIATTLKFGNNATATFPSTDGTSGQVLSTNANGTTSWITPPSGNATGMKFGNNATATFPSTDGTSGQVLSTNANGTTSWIAQSGGVSSPLTADLDVGSYVIKSSSNAKIVIEPNGTGPLQGSSGGNTRGSYSTDWQRNRTSASQVASGVNSTIGGGINNQASGPNSTVCGGTNNIASGENSTVVGGTSGQAAGVNSISLGGGFAYANGAGSIVGGPSATANSTAAIALGYYATATGSFSTVLGGLNNASSGNYSVSMGNNCTASYHGEVAQSGCEGVKTFVVTLYDNIESGTDVAIPLDGGTSYLEMLANTAWAIEANVLCFSPSFTIGHWKVTATTQCDEYGNATLINSSTTEIVNNIGVDYTTEVVAEITGSKVSVIASEVGIWAARVEVTELRYAELPS